MMTATNKSSTVENIKGAPCSARLFFC